jgi:hypothetical protein
MADSTQLDFSQHSLQDYQECHRRFKLKYLDRLAWPAAQTDDQLSNELHQRKGVDFHRMIQQWALGVPEAVLEENIRDSVVYGWWQSFLQIKDTLPGLTGSTGVLRLPEYTLSGWLDGFHLIAKYDLLVITPGENVYIFDWKTGQRPQAAEILSQRVQTVLYRFLVVDAGQRWNNGQKWQAEQIEMIYWQAADPLQPVRLPYSASQYDGDRDFLSGLLGEITRLPEDGFEKTEDIRKCHFCHFRTFCERGYQPGSQSEFEKIQEDTDIDLSTIDPVAYE